MRAAYIVVYKRCTMCNLGSMDGTGVTTGWHQTREHKCSRCNHVEGYYNNVWYPYLRRPEENEREILEVWE